MKYENKVPEEFTFEEEVDDLIIKENKFMESGMLKLNKENFKSALVYGLLWGLLAVAVRVDEVGDIFALNWRELVNVGVTGGLAVGISLLKNLLTTTSGNFLGAVKVIPPTE